MSGVHDPNEALILVLQAQLAAFLLGDTNASSTAMRSAAQLVQLLDPPPPPTAQALTQCPPALPPARPRSGHAFMPLPVTQVLPPRESHYAEREVGWGVRRHLAIGVEEAITGPLQRPFEPPCLLPAHLPFTPLASRVASRPCRQLLIGEALRAGMYMPDREMSHGAVANNVTGAHARWPYWSRPLQHGHACQQLQLACDSPPLAGLHLGSPPRREAQWGVAAVQPGPA